MQNQHQIDKYEVSGIFNIFLICIITTTLSVAIGSVFTVLFDHLSWLNKTRVDNILINELFIKDPYKFTLILLLSVMFEELVFRGLPIFVSLRYLNFTDRGLMNIIFISSIIFGYCHSDGIPNIFIQGVGGFFHCMQFLILGGFFKKFWKPFIIVTLNHFAFNFFVCIVAMIKHD